VTFGRLRVARYLPNSLGSEQRLTGGCVCEGDPCRTWPLLDPEHCAIMAARRRRSNVKVSSYRSSTAREVEALKGGPLQNNLPLFLYDSRNRDLGKVGAPVVPTP